MSLKITVHGGAGEIGGNCIEVATRETRILLDIGLPMSDRQATLPPNMESIDAIIVSHPHQDHYGLLSDVPRGVKVYIGGTAEKLIDAARWFCGEGLLDHIFTPLTDKQPFMVGDLTITPFMVDHSAYDAYAILVAGGGKTIMYSGDFRCHGRKRMLVERLMETPPTEVDALLVEGTMMERTNQEFPDETAVEEAMLKILGETNGTAFLICSSQNLDRVVSAYRACIRSGRIFVVDIYTAWVLRQFSEAPGTYGVPDISWEKIRVLSKGRTAGRHYQRLKEDRDKFGGFINEIYSKEIVITEETIESEPGKYLIKNPRPLDLVERLDLRQCSTLYSMWEGYLKEQYNPRGWQTFAKLKKRTSFVSVHTSGHAVKTDLIRFIKAMNPKVLIPIHTETPDGFATMISDVTCITNLDQPVEV